MKIVINTANGGFWISDEAYRFLGLRGSACPLPSRNDPELIRCVETLGERSWGMFATLKVIEIPDGIDWAIENYDGREWVVEKYRSWDEFGERTVEFE